MNLLHRSRCDRHVPAGNHDFDEWHAARALRRRVRALIENTTLYKVRPVIRWLSQLSFPRRLGISTQVLRQMPKGGALHLHVSASFSMTWVVNQGTLSSTGTRVGDWRVDVSVRVDMREKVDTFG